MKLVCPSYYADFQCAASACPDSCCHQWTVVVDEETAQRYHQLEGPLGDRLRQVMCREEGDMILRLRPDGRCPMWRDDGLCRIHAELGEDALCDTCRDPLSQIRHNLRRASDLEKSRKLIFDRSGHVTDRAEDFPDRSGYTPGDAAQDVRADLEPVDLRKLPDDVLRQLPDRV